MTKYQILSSYNNFKTTNWVSHSWTDFEDAKEDALRWGNIDNKFLLVKINVGVGAKVLEQGLWVKYGLHTADAHRSYEELEML